MQPLWVGGKVNFYTGMFIYIYMYVYVCIYIFYSMYVCVYVCKMSNVYVAYFHVQWCPTMLVEWFHVWSGCMMQGWHYSNSCRLNVTHDSYSHNVNTDW